MEIDEFIIELSKIGININEEQLKKFEQYFNMLISSNKKMNLTGIIAKKEVYLKHFYDSATLYKAIDLNEIDSLCDIGTGAGFPGLVLKILFPNLKVTLVESLHKRTIFLEQVVQELKLDYVEIYNERAEEFAKKNREIFDIVTSRAVSNLSILMEYSVPMVKVGGYFIPMKAKVKEELEQINNEMRMLNVELQKLIIFNLPNEGSSRTLVPFLKKKRTSLKFPRQYSLMKKKRL